MLKISKLIFLVVVVFLAGVPVVYAGSLTRPGSVSKTMYTFGDIYNLTQGITTTVGSGAIPATPGSANPTFYTIAEIYNVISVQMGNLSPGIMATGTRAFGITGTLYGGTDPSKVLTSATYPGTAHIAQPLITNQTICYDASGAVISCVGTGQDGESRKGMAMSYANNNDGTVTDNSTGLVWQKCTKGLSGTSCGTGSVTTADWTNALAYCNANTAGLPGTGWRLPNVNELLTIADYSRANPSINVTSFPATQSNYYWSATTYQGYLSNAWSVFFVNGGSYYNDKTNGFYVRCVRG